jgi:hypothetical protein
MRASIRDGERGSVTIVLAFSLTIFFVMAALAVDIGFLYLTKRRAQTVADMAALAAASKYSTSSTTAATNAAAAIETANGYTAGSPAATYPSSYRVQVVITLPPTRLVFGRIFGVASKTLSVTSVASAGASLPAIWAGGNCTNPLAPGLQLNGGPFHINGSLESNGDLNYFTGGGEVTNGDVTNYNGCPAPSTRGSVSGTISQSATTFPDPLGYNMLTDFPACTAGDLTTPLGLTMYNVPTAGGVIAPGVYCANGNVNLSSGSTITGSGVTILATGFITVSGPGLNISSAAAGAHNIIFFSDYTTADCMTQAINLGFPGGTLNGSIYAPKGCLQVSGDSYTIDGSVVGNEVQFGAGANWTVDSTTGGGTGDVGLFQ